MTEQIRPDAPAGPIIPALIAEPVAAVIREPRLVPDVYMPDAYGL